VGEEREEGEGRKGGEEEEEERRGKRREGGGAGRDLYGKRILLETHLALKDELVANKYFRMTPSPHHTPVLHIPL
jgi:hypothetical protein